MPMTDFRMETPSQCSIPHRTPSMIIIRDTNLLGNLLVPLTGIVIAMFKDKKIRKTEQRTSLYWYLSYQFQIYMSTKLIKVRKHLLFTKEDRDWNDTKRRASS